MILASLLCVLVVVLSSAIFSGCERSQNGERESVGLTKILVPRATESSQTLAESENAKSYEQEDTEPKVPIKRTELLLHLLNVNLDLDKTDEQILVLQDRAAADLPIRVAIVDFDEIRNTHVRSWEHKTQATNSRALRIETEDIVGDYSIEIICRGLNSSGELTLDVFRKTTSPSGLGLYYSPICQVSSDRRIKILREKRSQAYELGQKYGQSFPIVVERKAPNSENNLDVLRETYYWKYQEKRYVKSLVEEIPGDKVQQKQLETLFSGKSTKADFEEFLAGPWFKQNEIGNIIFFDTEYQTINFFDGNILEVYLIEDFLRHGYRISLITSNNTIASIKKWITISIQSTSVIEINTSQMKQKYVLDSEQWEGRYNRLTSDLLESFMQTQRSYVKVSHIDLSGVFRDNQGVEIAFEPPHFTWIDETAEGSSGGFSVLHDIPLLNGFYLEREIEERISVITFRFIEESGIPRSDKTYVLEHLVKADNNTVVKTIHLTPAELVVNGAILTSKESLTLEQIEIVQ
jgi:hypothetical protein